MGIFKLVKNVSHPKKARQFRGGNQLMYAVIKTGGKQYRVQLGDTISVEKLNEEVGATITFDEVLVMGEGADLKVGTPFIEGVSVGGKVVGAGKGEKVIIYKHKAKKDYRKKQGHRQPFTAVEITSIGDQAAPAKKEAPKTPAKEEAPEVEASTEVNLSAMKKNELLEYAAAKGIKVSASATKAVIIEAIEAAK